MEIFNKETISQLYPEAEDLMIEPAKIWKLPAGKENKLSEVCESGDYFLQEKIDGAFYQFVRTENHSYLFGRTVSVQTGVLTEKIANVPHIKEALAVLPFQTILIGEMYIPGGTSKNTTSIMGCLPAEAIKRQEKQGNIHYYVHDIIYFNGVNLIEKAAEERYRILNEIWQVYNLDQYNFLRLAAKVDTDLEAEISRILKNGGEGVVLKKRDQPYTPGKRPAWATIKIKQMDSVDLVCIGLCDATKEYTGKEPETWPYWAMINEDGNEVMTEECQFGIEGWYPVTKYYYDDWKTAIEIGAYDKNGDLIKLGTVSSGLTDADKHDMTKFAYSYIGRVVALDCMSLDKKELTLRHPVFKGWRMDKNAKDCLIEEIFS